MSIEDPRETESVSGSAPEPESAGDFPELNFEEVRVLGCLLEKEMTTPEHYPLSLNGLVTACNQKSNRDPIVAYDASTVAAAVESLRYKHLAATIHEAGARVPKTKHTLDRFLPYLERRHFALIAVLLLRGQQTVGELRQRTERMHPFTDLAAVQTTLDELILYGPFPLAKLYPPGSGRRVASYGHLLAGASSSESASTLESPRQRDPAPISHAPAPSEWRRELEERIANLQEDVSGLKAEVADLRRELGA